MFAVGGAVLVAVGSSNAAPITVNVVQNINEESGFTLDFGDFPGGVTSAEVFNTTFDLEIDPAAGTAWFANYYQQVDPLILPGGISTGDITIEIIASLGGTYDRATSVFTTNDIYAVHFTGDLSAFGIVSPFVLPSTSSAAVTFTGVSQGSTDLLWLGEGLLGGQDFSYQCVVRGTFASNNTTVFIASTVPSTGTVDARQPHALYDSEFLQGWEWVDVRFNFAPDVALSDTDFIVSEWGSDGVASITEIEVIDDDEIRVYLADPVAPAAWTTLTHLGSTTTACLGFLPGDVNGDGVSTPADVLATLACLEGTAAQACELPTVDTDRSGEFEPADLLRVVDLLNGAGEFAVWNGATLGTSPCPAG